MITYTYLFLISFSLVKVIHITYLQTFVQPQNNFQFRKSKYKTL